MVLWSRHAGCKRAGRMTTALLADHRSRSSTSARVSIALVVWFSVLPGLGVAGLLERPAIPLVPIGLFGATALLVLARSRSAALRGWLDALDLRVLIAFHIVRAPIGLWFLVMFAEGRLPGELALRAGWGDIGTGLLALAVLPLGLVRRRDRALVWTWNALGLADIMMVVGTAQWMLLSGSSAQLAGAQGMPFLLLPWFVVPLVITTHLLVFARLAATRYGSPQ